MLSVVVVHLRVYGMQFIAKGLGSYVRTSSFCVKVPGSTLPIELVTGRLGQEDCESMDHRPYSPDLLRMNSVSVGSLTST